MVEQPRLVTVRELFDGQRRYRVPIYQRSYAWGKVEIETLVRDIVSVLDKPAYYIGSLVAHHARDLESDRPVFDVVDGQQRLTTLIIILSHPGLQDHLEALSEPFRVEERLLTFEERKRSNLDLAALTRARRSASVLDELQDPGIRAGAEAVGNLLGDDERLALMLRDQRLTADSVGGQTIVHQVLEYLLDRVQIVLTELPHETDLNHYFEVMNTRGEQLQRHEIVKAHLLGLIGDDHDNRMRFAAIWDACADFSRHVQAQFEPGRRSQLFGDPGRSDDGWSRFMPRKYSEVASILGVEEAASTGESLDPDSLLESGKPSSTSRTTPRDDGDAGRYGAIIDFPNFLLHVLRLHAGGRQNVALDDKRLVEQFGATISTKEAVLEFGYLLLRSKFLFDNFIIKPLDEQTSGDDSNWVLHRMHHVRGEQNKPKLSPIAPFGTDSTPQLLMLQSMYQVTHQRRVYKEFLFECLEFLDGSWQRSQSVDGGEFIRHMHRMANDGLTGLDLQSAAGLGHQPFRYDHARRDRLDTGTGVPHFALNLLDYKLWLRGADCPVAGVSSPPPTSSFRFAYRTSVEHFRAVNFAESPEQKAVVDCFGNLCLMTRSENSRRSDHDPAWKAEKYGHTNQSLKFWYMMQRLGADRSWDVKQIVSQGEEMRRILFEPLDT